MSSASVEQLGGEGAVSVVLRLLNEAQVLLNAAERTSTPQLHGQAAALLRLAEGSGHAQDASLVGAAEGSRLLALTVAPERTGSLLRRLTADKGAVAAAAPGGQLLVLTRPGVAARGTERALRTAVMLAAEAQRTDPRSSAGISAPLRDGADLRAAARDARDAAELAGLRGLACCVVDDVAAALAVHRIRRALPAQLTSADPVAALLDHDRRKGTDLAATVRSWLANDRDTRLTAQALNLHPNTLRYRLRRLPDLCGFDPTDTDHLLLAQLLLLDH